MSKTKTPFFSLGSRGTIGDSVTTQRRGSLTVVREKPTPANPRSLAQRQQRARFLAACQMWNGLSASQKQAWQSAACRYHIIGFNLFTRIYLPTLTNLELYLPLNEGAGSIATDFSINEYHGTIFGATWSDGIFGSALYFDGLNDRLILPIAPLLADLPNSAIETWVKGPTMIRGSYAEGDSADASCFFILQIAAGKAWFGYRGTVGPAVAIQDTVNINDNEWHHLIGNRSTPNTVELWVDKRFVGSSSAALDPGTWDTASIGYQVQGAGLFYFKGLIDEVLGFSRCLTRAKIDLHFERGTPP